MDELDLDDFRYGGVNMTGFRLVDPEDDKVQTVQREWSRLNPNYWRGAGTDRKIKVRSCSPRGNKTDLVFDKNVRGF